MTGWKALIAGATGAIGGALAGHLAALPNWRVLGLCRHSPATPTSGVDLIHADMTDPDACRNALEPHDDITHLFYCGRAAHDDLGRENVQSNLDLLCHVLDAVSAASPGLGHVHLVQGGKYYGVHLGPFPTPAREDDARTVVSNFYYAQEDLLRERSASACWSWSASRPNTLLHFSPHNPRNLASTLGAYAAICRELGCALDFPGCNGAYTSLTQLTSTDLLSRAMAWMATDARAADQAFNIANGDLVRWCRLWPKLAEAYQIPMGSVRPLDLVEVMADKQPVWEGMVKRYRLEKRPLGAVAHWAYADGTLERSWDEIMSTTKARQFGFHDAADSEAVFLQLLGRYREAKLLP
ncbi:MAG: SDR family oxidoreductase [Alphaproteobacteria bacterium]|nr:SDR family oxidoreductase [Alphaproteobacteria bacterium]